MQSMLVYMSIKWTCVHVDMLSRTIVHVAVLSCSTRG